MTILNNLRRSLLRHMRNAPIESLDPRIPHSVVIPVATYSPWRTDPGFQDVYASIKGNTLVDIYRCHDLWSLIGQLDKIPGDILEVGVWKGGTGCLMAARASRLATRKQVFLCDTFSGVVKASEKDTLYSGGEHSDSTRHEVEVLAARLRLDNISILPGIFPEDTGANIEARKFSFCHIDVDAYLSAKDVLAWVTPRLAMHGMVVFDDYGFFGCEGVTRLVNELSGVPDFHILTNLNGHAVMLKIAQCTA